MLAPNTYISKWSKWVALNLKHRASGIKASDLLIFEPCEQTEKFLNKINAVFRKHNESYSIFINDLNSDKLVLNLKNLPEKLNFEGIINNKDFILVSNTEYLANRIKVSYINNLKQYPVDELNTSLSKSPYINPDDLETLDIMPLTFNFKVAEKITDEAVTFFDAMQQRIEGVIYHTQLTDNNQTLVTCDFTKCSNGACTVKINGKEFNRFYITGRKKLNLVVEIFIKPSNKLKPIWDGKKFGIQNLLLAFDTKATHWRYILISRSEEKNIYDITDVVFELNGEKIPILPLEKKELVNGVNCLYATFKDDKPLRINTFNHEILKMKIINAKKWNQSSIRMPIPTYKNVQRIDRYTGTTYSLMYVYI